MFNQSLAEVTCNEHDFISKSIDSIRRYGFCVIKDVLSNDESVNLFNGITNTLSYVTSQLPVPFDINNTNTWNTLKSLRPVKGMIFQNWGLGHCQELWNLRCNQKIIDIFNLLYGYPIGSKELLVSYDAFSFQCPPEYTGNDDFEINKWYHYDQSLERQNFECLQSWIAATDTYDGDATLAVMIYSHNLHSQIKQIIPGFSSNGDFVMLNEYIDLFKSFGCIEHRVKCPKGSLVIWDSRLLHYGAKPLKGRPNHNFRCVAYLSYTPRFLGNEKDIKRKSEIIGKRGSNGYLRTTNHWPHRPIMFPEIPSRMTKANIPNILPLPNPYINPEYLYLTGK